MAEFEVAMTLWCVWESWWWTCGSDTGGMCGALVAAAW